MANSLAKVGAGLYTLTHTSSANTKALTIYNYDGVQFSTPYSKTLAIGDTSYSIDISSEGDGVYMLKIVETGVVTVYMVIYEFSSMVTCQKSLINQIFSTETCTEDNDVLRGKLNQLIAYTGYILARTNIENIRYLDIFTMDETRIDYVNDTGNLMDKVNLITTNC